MHFIKYYLRAIKYLRYCVPLHNYISGNNSFLKLWIQCLRWPVSEKHKLLWYYANSFSVKPVWDLVLTHTLHTELGARAGRQAGLLARCATGYPIPGRAGDLNPAESRRQESFGTPLDPSSSWLASITYYQMPLIGASPLSPPLLTTPAASST